MLNAIAKVAAHVLHPRLAWQAISGRRWVCRKYRLSWRDAGELILAVRQIDDRLGEGYGLLMRRGVVANARAYRLTAIQLLGLMRRLAELSDPGRGLTLRQIIERVEQYAQQIARSSVCPPARPEQKVQT